MTPTTSPTPIPRPSPRVAGFHQPAEWDHHEATWLAWPSHEDLWGDALEPVREAWLGMARAIGEGERLEVLVPDAAKEAEARGRLSGLPRRLHRIPFGDIWLRDTAPVFLTARSGATASVSFAFNGWGGKHVLPGDDGVAAHIAAEADVPHFHFPWVLEGGAVDVDGEGTCLTTRQCLLNPNRNAGKSSDEMETCLRDTLGVEKVLWLGDGLLNDHTDGHVDTLARFVAPGRVVCMTSADAADPNRAGLLSVQRDLTSFQDAKGRRLEVVTVPSPGRVTGSDGEVMPASYVNFYISNAAVIVPAYGAPNDERARAVIAELFPSRKTISLPARRLLEGGGAFHCITQQQPGSGDPMEALLDDTAGGFRRRSGPLLKRRPA
jgi:agmatine deiminase